MRILMAASEAAPFARTGGLGDVMGALPTALTKLGHQLVVALPWYQSIPKELTETARLGRRFKVRVGDRESEANVFIISVPRTKLSIWLVDGEEWFGRPELYRDPATGVDYADNLERYLFFARAVLAMAEQSGFDPAVIHAHDWQAALLPILIKYDRSTLARFESVKSVLTIHNLGYQGQFPAESFDTLDLPPEMFHAVTGPLEFYGQVNLLKGGIMAADRITTVSNTYAREIQTKAYGAGLEGVLSARASDLIGIVNGVDYKVWSPSRDKKIPYRFGRANLGGKRNCRVELLNRVGLPIREDTPLIGMISRLADQKGFDLIEAVTKELMGMNLQIVLLGTGESRYHELFKKLEKQYPDKLKAYLAFDDELAHQIEAGADMFLMPSQYEPCGLNQLYSLRYGTVPIVRKTGGLADTVIDYDEKTLQGTGFVFEEYTPEAMLEAIKRAIDQFGHKRRWKELVKRGMAEDFSWGSSAEQYSDLYDVLRS